MCVDIFLHFSSAELMYVDCNPVVWGFESITQIPTVQNVSSTNSFIRNFSSKLMLVPSVGQKKSIQALVGKKQITVVSQDSIDRTVYSFRTDDAPD